MTKGENNIARDAQGPEGQALTDLLVRLVSRLYPTLLFRAEQDQTIAERARELALRINPRVECTGTPTVEIVIGSGRLRPWARRRIFAGSSAWTAQISTVRPQSCGETRIPFGAGVAACLAAANLFRHCFLPEPQLDTNAVFAFLNAEESVGHSLTLRGISAELVLAGAGAIGNAAAWALARTSMEGVLHVVDHESIDLGNLQRYVLTERTDESASKPAVVSQHFGGSLIAKPFEGDLASFLESKNQRVDRLLLAVDSARDRRAGQASLPRWVANAWTQPGDLGVSIHDFLNGACVCCLYLPDSAQMNEDAIIAEAFGVPDRLMQIRVLLHRNEGAPRDLLEAIALSRHVPLERLVPFEGRRLRDLYVEGFCGGAVIPLSQISAPRAEVHVPLAHQSACAGVLLAAAAVRDALGMSAGSHITQLDLLKRLPAFPTRVAAKDPRGICVCQDSDYREVYERKFRRVTARPKSGSARPRTGSPTMPRQRSARGAR